jgi:transketolase
MAKANIDLNKIAKEIRKDILYMTTNAESGHPTSSFSCVEILVALYFKVMKHDPKNPEWSERDRFIMSKGHAAPALYAVLGQCGYFSKKEYDGLRAVGRMLQGHPHNIGTPGVEISTGSLGTGLSVGNGMAWAGKLDKKNYHVFVLFGDGELQEGQVWESLWTTKQFGLDNVTIIIDRNGLQNDGWVKDTKDPEPLDKKLEAFGWRVIKCNGHDFEELLNALEDAKSDAKPTALIAKTVKGKGVSFIENSPDWHGKALSKEEYLKALKELDKE